MRVCSGSPPSTAKLTVSGLFSAFSVSQAANRIFRTLFSCLYSRVTQRTGTFRSGEVPGTQKRMTFLLPDGQLSGYPCCICSRQSQCCVSWDPEITSHFGFVLSPQPCSELGWALFSLRLVLLFSTGCSHSSRNKECNSAQLLGPCMQELLLAPPPPPPVLSLSPHASGVNSHPPYSHLILTTCPITPVPLSCILPPR